MCKGFDSATSAIAILVDPIGTPTEAEMERQYGAWTFADKGVGIATPKPLAKDALLIGPKHQG